MGRISSQRRQELQTRAERDRAQKSTRGRPSTSWWLGNDTPTKRAERNIYDTRRFRKK